MAIMVVLMLGALLMNAQVTDEVFLAVSATEDIMSEIEVKKMYAEVKSEVINSLNRKYGNGNFEVVSMNKDTSHFLELEMRTSYMKSTFVVSVAATGAIREDDFIDVYAKEMWNVDDVEAFAIAKAKEKSDSLFSKYDMKYKNDHTNFQGLYDYEEGKLPTVDDLISRVNFGRIKRLIIGDSYTKEDLDKFTKNIIEVYEIYALETEDDYYSNDTLHFEFENGNNPFQDPSKDKIGAYADSGYIRDAGSLYLLYLNPTPFKINK